MINVCLVFGGISCEHDISIITAMQIMSNLNKEKYKVIPVYINKQGNWLYNKNYTCIENILSDSRRETNCFLLPNSNYLYKKDSFNFIHKIEKIDIVFVSMHGINGEDGMIKALCDNSKLKCVCSDIFGSSLALDKCIFKSYIKGIEDIFVIDSIQYNEFQDFNDLVIEIKQRGFNYPLIIKPSRLGSSIGISVCHNEKELREKINYSLRFDSRLLIEKKVKNFKELNIACFRDKKEIIISEIEEPINTEEILTYSRKYLSGEKKSSEGMASIKRKFPAKVNFKLKSKIHSIVNKVYSLLDLSGVVRFDFIYDIDENKLYLNELNTIPGSYAHYLFKDYKFSEILDKCIENEYYNQQIKDQKIKYFASSVLKNTSLGIKK